MSEEECRYCSHYQNVPDSRRTREGTKEDPIYRRRCPKAGRYLFGSEPACEGFVMHPLFWCELKSQWIYVLACLRSYGEREREECYRCSQGENIALMARGKRYLTQKNNNGGNRRLVQHG